MVCELGRLEGPGRPILLGTSEEFLRRFGVEGLNNLPKIDENIIDTFKEEADKEISMTIND